MWQPSMTSFSGALNYVNACPNQPEPGRVFCADHCQSAESKSVPTTLKEFTKYSKGICICGQAGSNTVLFIMLLSSLWLHAQNTQIGCRTSLQRQLRQTAKVNHTYLHIQLTI